MGAKLVEAYDTYLRSNITSVGVYTLCRKVLELGDDLNATEAASSSGKYHPIADLGEGGLVRHSITVAEVAKILMRSRPLYDKKEDGSTYDSDVVIVSAVLHDVCKYDSNDSGKTHTNFDHPIKAAELVKKAAEELGMIGDFDPKPTAERIAKNIASHMSRWNTSKYNPGIELPLVEDEEQRIISDADLIAANAQLPETMIVFREQAIKTMVGR